MYFHILNTVYTVCIPYIRENRYHCKRSQAKSINIYTRSTCVVAPPILRKRLLPNAHTMHDIRGTPHIDDADDDDIDSRGTRAPLCIERERVAVVGGTVPAARVRVHILYIYVYIHIHKYVHMLMHSPMRENAVHSAHEAINPRDKCSSIRRDARKSDCEMFACNCLIGNRIAARSNYALHSDKSKRKEAFE